MIYRIISVALLLILLNGCSENHIVVPEETNNFSLQKEMLQIPVSKSLNRLSTQNSFSEEIDGTVGGEINFHYDYNISETAKVNVTGKLFIPAGAFDTVENFKIVIDNEFAFIDFYPSPLSFNIPLELDLEYFGLDLTEISIDDVDYYFVDESLINVELIEHDEKVLEIVTGSLTIVNAKINHFSRYAWLK